MMETIVTALIKFFMQYKADLAVNMIASGGFELLKKTLDFPKLKGMLKGFFNTGEQTDRFIEEICSKEISAEGDLEGELKKVYSDVSQLPYDDKLFTAIKDWMMENKAAILELNENTVSHNSGGFNIGSQRAGGNIYNIQGDFKPKNS